MNTHSLSSAATPASLTDPAENPYLQGNFAPVLEELTLGELEVTGAIPRELEGRLLRQGPNPVGKPAPNHHWFLGHGMVHAIVFEGGRARGYRNRFVRTRALESALARPAAPSSPHGLPGFSNVNVITHAGRILSLGEVGLPYELSPELETLREYDYDGRLRTHMTAHPKIDPHSGELVFFGYDFGPVHLRYHVASPRGELLRTLEIPLPRPVMIHDFAVTQTRVVFMDLPVVFDLDMVVAGHALPFRWDDSHTARLGVMRRDAQTAEVRWFEIPPCFVFHVLNAYDDGERLVMDVVRHDRTFDQSRIGPEHDTPPTLHRFTLDPVAGRVHDEALDLRAQEFPRVSPRVETTRHRYGYAVELARPQSFTTTSLLKHDLEAGETKAHDVGRGRHVSEGVFVPVGAGEDEGYVLATVYDERENRSDVVILDAQRFDEKPVATIHLPTRIPFGFHGNWIDARAGS